METHLSENVAFKQGILCVVERWIARGGEGVD